jgi:hypothetical protein
MPTQEAEEEVAETFEVVIKEENYLEDFIKEEMEEEESVFIPNFGSPEVCRLCGTENHFETLCDIKDPELKIEAKLMKVFNVNLSDEKLLPQSVCNQCLIKLNNAIAFVDDIKETQEKLSKDLSKKIVLFDQPSTSRFASSFDFAAPKQIEKVKKKTENKIKQIPRGLIPQPRDLILVEDIFDVEMTKGTFQSPPDTLEIELDDDEKNLDGSPNEAGKERLKSFGWSSYKWKCSECEMILDSLNYFEEHFKTAHKKCKTSYSCIDCDFEAKKYFPLHNHIIEHEKRKHLKFFCEFCDEFKTNLVDLQKHRHEFHPKYRNTCVYCGWISAAGIALKNHAGSKHSVSLEKNLYHCDVCGFKTVLIHVLKNHIKRKHSTTSPIICDQCGKTFKTQSDLRSHQLVHVQDRNFACDICEMRFKHKSNFAKHRQIHFAKDFKFECKICSKKFHKISNLNYHISTIHTDKHQYTW